MSTGIPIGRRLIEPYADPNREVRSSVEGSMQVALLFEGAGNWRPGDGVEFREVEAEDVALTESDWGGFLLQGHLLKAQLRWKKHRLTDEGVDPIVQRPRAPHLQRKNPIITITIAIIGITAFHPR